MRSIGLGVAMSRALLPLLLQACSDEPENSAFLDSQTGDVRVADVAIYQVVKIPLLSAGRAVVERNAPVMEGKDALLRIFLEPLPAFEARELEVEVAWRSAVASDAWVARHWVSGKGEQDVLESTVNFVVPGASITSNVDWAVTLREVASAGTRAGVSVARYPADPGQLEALGARRLEPLRVELVPYRYRADGSGRLPDVTDEQLARYRAFLLRYYPISEVVFDLHAPVDYQHVVDPASGWDEFLDFHCALRATEQPAPSVFYYGLIEPTATALQYSDGAVGRSYIPALADIEGRCSVGLGFSGGGSALIMAHELGHAFGMRHAPCGADDAGPFPYPDGKIGSWGFDFATQTLMAPDARYDLMSVCTPVFTSDYTYLRVFERLLSIDQHLRPQ